MAKRGKVAGKTLVCRVCGSTTGNNRQTCTDCLNAGHYPGPPFKRIFLRPHMPWSEITAMLRRQVESAPVAVTRGMGIEDYRRECR